MRDVEESSKYVKTDDRIIIKESRHILVFYPQEITRLVLKHDESLYITALKRGKSELRYRANEKRHY